MKRGTYKHALAVNTNWRELIERLVFEHIVRRASPTAAASFSVDLPYSTHKFLREADESRKLDGSRVEMLLSDKSLSRRGDRVKGTADIQGAKGKGMMTAAICSVPKGKGEGVIV